MPLRYGSGEHREYLDMAERVGIRWRDLLRGEMEVYSGVYWDLLSRLWRAGGPVRKTDALGFMTAVRSAHTAGKHVETAIRAGMVVETANPADGRSKLLSLSPRMERRLDGFFDMAVDEVRRSARRLDRK